MYNNKKWKRILATCLFLLPGLSKSDGTLPFEQPMVYSSQEIELRYIKTQIADNKAIGCYKKPKQNERGTLTINGETFKLQRICKTPSAHQFHADSVTLEGRIDKSTESNILKGTITKGALRKPVTLMELKMMLDR